jgi:hypothetical protein
VTRPRLGWPAAGLAVAFAIVLGVPPAQRALAVYAFVLLIGALVLAALVAALAAAPAGADARLEGPLPAPDQHPVELDAFEQDVRDALREGAIGDRLRVQLRQIAAMRLERRHAVDIDADAQAAERLLAGSPALALAVAPRPRGRERARLRPADLARAVDELEAL